MIRNMAVPGLLALGVSFVFLVSRIDLSVGSLTIFGPILAVSSLAFLGDIFDFKVLVRGNQYANSAAFLVVVSLLTGILVGLFKWSRCYVWKNYFFYYDTCNDESFVGIKLCFNSWTCLLFQIPTYTWMGTLNLFYIPFSTWIYILMTIIAGIIMNYTLGR